jgi:hypothetical protein
LEKDDFDYPAYFESLRASANVEAK